MLSKVYLKFKVLNFISLISYTLHTLTHYFRYLLCCLIFSPNLTLKKRFFFLQYLTIQIAFSKKILFFDNSYSTLKNIFFIIFFRKKFKYFNTQKIKSKNTLFSSMYSIGLKESMLRRETISIIIFRDITRIDDLYFLMQFWKKSFSKQGLIIFTWNDRNEAEKLVQYLKIPLHDIVSTNNFYSLTTSINNMGFFLANHRPKSGVGIRVRINDELDEAECENFFFLS